MVWRQCSEQRCDYGHPAGHRCWVLRLGRASLALWVRPASLVLLCPTQGHGSHSKARASSCPELAPAWTAAARKLMGGGAQARPSAGGGRSSSWQRRPSRWPSSCCSPCGSPPGGASEDALQVCPLPPCTQGQLALQRTAASSVRSLPAALRAPLLRSSCRAQRGTWPARAAPQHMQLQQPRGTPELSSPLPRMQLTRCAPSCRSSTWRARPLSTASTSPGQRCGACCARPAPCAAFSRCGPAVAAGACTAAPLHDCAVHILPPGSVITSWAGRCQLSYKPTAA